MNDITLERYYHDPALRRELEAAARRERARHMQRFLAQAAQALLGGNRAGTSARRVKPAQPCGAC